MPELCVTERYVSWLQFDMVARVTHMRVKASQMVINKKGEKIPYIDSLDFIRVRKDVDHDISVSFDYFKIKCTERWEKIILQFMDTNHPETRPDGENWIESYDDDELTGDPDYKYYHLSNVMYIFKDAFFHWHSESPEFFSIFSKEDMVDESSLDFKRWSIQVPRTPAEIREENIRRHGWRK
jgi:hypothetical protein